MFLQRASALRNSDGMTEAHPRTAGNIQSLYKEYTELGVMVHTYKPSTGVVADLSIV
jgi:hypothetical protein